MTAKKAAVFPATRGSGRPNVLLIQDYATKERIFRVETEIRRTTANSSDFNALVRLVRKRVRTAEDKRRATSLAHDLVDGLRTPAAEARAAKAMFAKALGV